MRLVVRLHGGLIDAGGGLEPVHGQHEVTHLAFLVLEVGEARELERGEKIRRADAAFELHALHRGAQVLLVGLQRDTRLGERRLGGLGRVLATDLERLLAVHRLAQRVLTHAVAQIARALREQRPADQALQHLVLEPPAQWGGDLRAAQALLPLRLLAQPGLARLLERDLAAVRLGGVIGAAETQIHDAVGAPGDEHQGERHDDNVGEPPVARGALQGVSDSLKHDEAGSLENLAERTGLEPATPGVTGRYSNQLNYRSEFGGPNPNGLMNKATSGFVPEACRRQIRPRPRRPRRRPGQPIRLLSALDCMPPRRGHRQLVANLRHVALAAP